MGGERGEKIKKKLKSETENAPLFTQFSFLYLFSNHFSHWKWNPPRIFSRYAIPRDTTQQKLITLSAHAKVLFMVNVLCLGRLFLFN